jgi:hypothetical protein
VISGVAAELDAEVTALAFKAAEYFEEREAGYNPAFLAALQQSAREWLIESLTAWDRDERPIFEDWVRERDAMQAADLGRDRSL